MTAALSCGGKRAFFRPRRGDHSNERGNAMNTIIHAACINGMTELPSASVDIVLTDPPIVSTTARVTAAP
jgi:hypothetical protein